MDWDSSGSADDLLDDLGKSYYLVSLSFPTPPSVQEE